MKFPNKEQVERVRETYPKGARVELVSMSDPYTTLKPGDLGTVDHVDDIATVFVNWDNGSTLGAVYGVDSIKRVPKISGTVRAQILAVRATGKTNMFDTNAVQRIANDLGYYELVCFIEDDRKAYAAFILTGGTDDVE